MLTLFHGDKGGTGKSTVCKGFVDFCASSGRPVTLIDADCRNPDVLRMFGNRVPGHDVNLRTEDGWAGMVEAMTNGVGNTNIAVNLPAGIGEEDERRSEIFLEAAREIQIPVVLIWVINRGVDSVNQLRHQLEKNAFNGMSKMFCVRNQYFAREGEAFDIWDDSVTRQMFEKKGGLTVDFPALSDRVVTTLDKENVPYSAALTENLLGTWDRMVLQVWVRKVATFFSEMNLPIISGESVNPAKSSK